MNDIYIFFLPRELEWYNGGRYFYGLLKDISLLTEAVGGCQFLRFKFPRCCGSYVQQLLHRKLENICKTLIGQK